MPNKTDPRIDSRHDAISVNEKTIKLNDNTRIKHRYSDGYESEWEYTSAVELIIDEYKIKEVE